MNERPDLSRSRVVLIDAGCGDAEVASEVLNGRFDGLVDELTGPLSGELPPSSLRLLHTPLVGDAVEVIIRAAAESDDLVTVLFVGDLHVESGPSVSLDLGNSAEPDDRFLPLARLYEILARRPETHALVLLDCRYMTDSGQVVAEAIERQIADAGIGTVASPVGVGWKAEDGYCTPLTTAFTTLVRDGVGTSQSPVLTPHDVLVSATTYLRALDLPGPLHAGMETVQGRGVVSNRAFWGHVSASRSSASGSETPTRYRRKAAARRATVAMSLDLQSRASVATFLTLATMGDRTHRLDFSDGIFRAVAAFLLMITMLWAGTMLHSILRARLPERRVALTLLSMAARVGVLWVAGLVSVPLSSVFVVHDPLPLALGLTVNELSWDYQARARIAKRRRGK